jgi:hypothetical protein
VGQNITEATLRELIAADTIEATCLIGQQGGFSVIVRCGKIERTLGNTRGSKKVFASLDTAVPYLKRLGITRLTVDASKFEPGRLRKPRPDRAAALKKTRTLPRQQDLI